MNGTVLPQDSYSAFHMCACGGMKGIRHGKSKVTDSIYSPGEQTVENNQSAEKIQKLLKVY